LGRAERAPYFAAGRATSIFRHSTQHCGDYRGEFAPGLS